VRLLYLDEAGISNRLQEPYLVVAGVLVDADRQLKSTVNELDAIKRRHGLDDEKYQDFHFHGLELQNGGKFLKREDWPLERRLEILSDIASIPRKIGLGIVAGYTSRKAASDFEKGEAYQVFISYQVAFSLAVACADDLMKKVYDPSEVGLIIAENNNETRRGAKLIQQMISNKKMVDKWIGDLIDPLSERLPITKFVDTVHFAEKREAPILQVADVVSFIIKRGLAGAAHSKRPLRDLLGDELELSPHGGMFAGLPAPPDDYRAAAGRRNGKLPLAFGMP
jgi:hypothetical protein